MRLALIYGVWHAWMEGQDFHRYAGIGYCQQSAIEDWESRQ
jgi:hypothetical protein